MTISRHLSFLLHCLVCTVLLTAARYHDKLSFLSEKVVVVDQKNLDIPSGQPLEFQWAPGTNFRSFSVAFVEFRTQFEFRADEVGPFQNLFQTNNTNQGFRYEIGSRGDSALLFKQGKNFGYILFKKNVVPNQWYHFSADFDGRMLEGRLDGVGKSLEVDFIGVREMRQLFLGKGFDETRVFRGDIRNGSIYLAFYRRTPTYLLVMVVYWIVLGFSLYRVFRAGVRLYRPLFGRDPNPPYIGFD